MHNILWLPPLPKMNRHLLPNRAIRLRRPLKLNLLNILWLKAAPNSRPRIRASQRNHFPEPEPSFAGIAISMFIVPAIAKTMLAVDRVGDSLLVASRTALPVSAASGVGAPAAGAVVV